MSLKKACLIVKATNSRVGSIWLPTLVGWSLLSFILTSPMSLAAPSKPEVRPNMRYEANPEG